VSRWEGKYVIGLTGNIAMGKSLVRRMLEHLGALTIDADGLAQRITDVNAPAYQPVVEMFGKFILQADGQIDRGRLGAIAFAHPDALKTLENITHPVISDAIDTLIAQAKHKVIVVEAIKLLESDLAGMIDSVWVVDSTPENQLKRLMARDRQPEAYARKRISIQNPQVDKLAKADVVITNNGTQNELWTQVSQAWAKIGKGTEDTQALEAVERVEVQPTATPTQQEITSFDVKRPRPTDFDNIANLINAETGSKLTRDDIMANFGGKSYLLAEANGQPLGIIAFLVDNLVTRVDEFVISKTAPVEAVGTALIKAMEKASDELQSEIAFVFLPQAAPHLKAVFVGAEYEEKEVSDIKYPAWREAINESKPADTVLLARRLRESLVLKPI